jgi:5'-nucleotidase
VQILLTNDDGIYAPGLDAMHAALQRLGQVQVVAPFVEQSGVSHTITFLEPVQVREIFRDGRLFGRAVQGTPADCVRLAMLEFCNPLPDLVVSGMNAGANAGINVLYSGTVAAAIEGAFYGVTAVAVSLAESEQPDWPRAAALATNVIEQLLASGAPPGTLWNLNLPALKSGWPMGVKTLPMSLERYREVVEKRIDPKGKPYYWVGTDPRGGHVIEPDTDVEALAEGYITLTPLYFDLNHHRLLEQFRSRLWTLT